MHPFGTYLAITTAQRQPDWVAMESQPAAFAPVDDRPLVEVKPRSRLERLAQVMRRRVLRTTGA